MGTLKFQLWGVFFRTERNIDERLDNIWFTVGALFMIVPAMILMIAGFYYAIPWLAVLGTFSFLYTIGRFIAGLVSW